MYSERTVGIRAETAAATWNENGLAGIEWCLQNGLEYTAPSDASQFSWHWQSISISSKAVWGHLLVLVVCLWLYWSTESSHVGPDAVAGCFSGEITNPANCSPSLRLPLSVLTCESKAWAVLQLSFVGSMCYKTDSFSHFQFYFLFYFLRFLKRNNT